MIFTIYTDASMCPWTKAAGWGAWMRDQRRSFSFNGVIEHEMRNTTDAEIAAMAYAMREAKRVFEISRGDMVVFVTDSENARQAINHRSIRRNRLQDNIRNYLIQSLPSHARLKVNRVQGHSTDDGVRSRVNDIVHNLALDAMRLERKRREKAA